MTNDGRPAGHGPGPVGGTGAAPREPDSPMTLPLRRTPWPFRWWLTGCLVLLGVGFAALHAFAPGPDLRAIAVEPGALLLLALILLADFYPTLPWMRKRTRSTSSSSRPRWPSRR